MTQTTTAATTDTVVRYLKFWNASPADQPRLGADLFTADVTYVTPIGVSTGIAALTSFTEQFRDGVGAYEFRARTEPDVHHDRARLQWEILVDGISFAAGTDVMITDESGRVQAITAFLDRAPDGFDPDGHH